MKRGQIWWAEIPEPLASEPGYRRPAVIVQADDVTESRINTVIVVPLTSTLRLATAPGNVLMSRKKTGLKRDSVANVSQIISFDKRFLTEPVGQVDHLTMHQIDEGIRLLLAL